ncbi:MULTISPECIES: 2-hydroxyacid dehydrogenase [unclassified Caballeronia]|uniref:2-hydroxyacid dehydrogenase n=1 Tax=unclassified Caballeronia TaxID=2646786 RepID=UPI00285D74B3|nr:MULTISPECIES: 2-hydroxyacid dehydrogenase [unclassified Caballeronia]MDR5751487.1 2-hydroxyacid dehydrogenase [Caballeronia sp. LZ024]MDR5844372.1 2-hydroxyacid dehydrogenase [Caballeronia sp. LZ031]
MPTRMIVFSSRQYDVDSFNEVNAQYGIELDFQESHLDAETAVLARGFEAVCPFVNDRLDMATLEKLYLGGTRLVALRSAGFNHVDLPTAKRLGMTVARVPAYSPHAVAEHAVGMILTLNRRFHRAVARTREGDFSLNGLLGFDLYGKTVGVIGTGVIGRVFGGIMAGFGMNVLAYDPGTPAEDLLARGARYVPLDTLLAESDVVSLHCPLLPATYHLIDERALGKMKRGAMLINTGRGGLVESNALIGALKSGQLGHLGLDVYEEEGGLFFEDHSNRLLQDDVLARLLMFPNVIVTSHQAFFTREALLEIATTTLGNVKAWQDGAPTNVVEG